jgi:hypothetical protein
MMLWIMKMSEAARVTPQRIFIIRLSPAHQDAIIAVSFLVSCAKIITFY